MDGGSIPPISTKPLVTRGRRHTMSASHESDMKRARVPRHARPRARFVSAPEQRLADVAALVASRGHGEHGRSDGNGRLAQEVELVEPAPRHRTAAVRRRRRRRGCGKEGAWSDATTAARKGTVRTGTTMRVSARRAHDSSSRAPRRSARAARSPRCSASTVTNAAKACDAHIVGSAMRATATPPPVAGADAVRRS